ncbi:MAG: A/G-specific adenine glycosylase [Acidimicrobiales bacterium]
MLGSPDVEAVLAWSAGRRDDLPWRQTRDPWAILVSELMLQQTQVSRVVLRWHQFLDRFPTIVDCAFASVGDVVTEWAGLGYNRRAVNLHRTAVAVVEVHEGKIPQDLDALLALPGVGAYTARAILAFAFERDVAVVDTNVGRILARQRGVQLTPSTAQSFADDIVPEAMGWSWNQGVLDLGALVCTKRAPTCANCPTAHTCCWFVSGSLLPDPAIGSAAVSKGQSKFVGSFREGRARLLDVLRTGVEVSPEQFRKACGWVDRKDGELESIRAADSLVRDGLAIKLCDGALALP